MCFLETLSYKHRQFWEPGTVGEELTQPYPTGGFEARALLDICRPMLTLLQVFGMGFSSHKITGHPEHVTMFDSVGDMNDK